MSEEFKSKLVQYTNGTLSEKEHQEMEEELRKFEIYQQYLDEMMNDMADKKDTIPQKIIRRAKQKSLISNVVATLMVIMIIIVVLQHISAFHLSSSHHENTAVIDAAIQTMLPNVHTSFATTSSSGFFQLEHMYDLERRIGNENIQLGELTTRFRFNNLRDLRIPRSVTQSMALGSAIILYPTDFREGLRHPESFDYLEQLPEATMAEIHISFNQFMTTEEVFQLFNNREISLDWLAVYSGGEVRFADGSRDEFDIEAARVGFPYSDFSFNLHLLYLEAMQIADAVENEDGYWYTIRDVSEISAEQRENEFMFALSLLAENNDIAERFLRHERNGVSIGPMSTDFRIIYDYISQNGIQIPGVVVTGPTTELLTLRDEPWISHIWVNEVTFLNWTSVLEN